MRVMKIKRGKRQDKPFLSENEVWCSQHSVMVVAGQLVSQSVVLEGHPQRAKSGWGVKMINPTMVGGIKGHSCEQWKGGIATTRNRDRVRKKKREKKNTEIREKHE